MRVRSLAHLPEINCIPDQEAELPDEIGELYLARNVVARIDLPKKVKVEEPLNPPNETVEEKSEAAAEVETAALEGAPETALGRGSRRSRRKKGANQ